MDDSTVFTCQECKQPIYIDASLVDLSPTAYDVLQASLPKKEPSTSKQPSRRELVDHVPASKEMKDIWEKAQQSQQPEQSFILLQESVLRDMPPSTPTPSSSKHPKSTSPKSPKQTVKQVSLSHRIQSHAKLFSFLSANSEVDHPLCEECTHVLYTALTKKLEETKRERDGYIAFEREIRKEKERSKGKEEEDLKEVIEKLKREESKAMEELRGADAERIALEEELAALEEEERALEKEEEECVLYLILPSTEY
jgi:beclin 1